MAWSTNAASPHITITPADRAAVDMRRQILHERSQVSGQVLPNNPLMVELERAWMQIELLQSSLDRTNKLFSDASRAWEQQLRAEREWWVQALVTIKDQCLVLENTVRSERNERVGVLQNARSLAARLDATMDELLQKGRALTATQQQLTWRIDEERFGATRSHLELAEATKLKEAAELERNNLVKEVYDLERRFQVMRSAAAGSVSSIEVDKSLLLVASLWHAAGRKAPLDTMEAAEMHVTETLNAWRSYFQRDVKMEAPYLRPNNSLILEPLRLAVGRRITEVLMNEHPRTDASMLQPPRITVSGGNVVRAL
mmetsp:Transcript_68700/g.108999  ORF Transcript_68700/g.108999 Transcript_68700/m.108999 type:complete len:314 (-) Transcript_68700:8-949(-)